MIIQGHHLLQVSNEWGRCLGRRLFGRSNWRLSSRLCPDGQYADALCYFLRAHRFYGAVGSVWLRRHASPCVKIMAKKSLRLRFEYQRILMLKFVCFAHLDAFVLNLELSCKSKYVTSSPTVGPLVCSHPLCQFMTTSPQSRCTPALKVLCPQNVMFSSSHCSGWCWMVRWYPMMVGWWLDDAVHQLELRSPNGAQSCGRALSCVQHLQ